MSHDHWVKVKVKVTGAKSVSVCPVQALTFESFDIQISNISKYPGQSRGSRTRTYERK